MITNLQNIKNSLKKTKSDEEILSFVSGFEFTDGLIEEHLKNLKNKSKSSAPPKMVPRDPKAYRDFHKKLDIVKDRYDPFTNFYLREAGQKEMTRKELPEKIRKAKTQDEKDFYQEVLDNMMLTEQSSEVSDINVGTHVIKRKDFHYDLETLVRDENNYDRNAEVYSTDISDEYFLLKRRREAEANFIKTKIIHKLHKDAPLSKSETKYLKEWNTQISDSKYFNIDKCMVPAEPCSYTIGNLGREDNQHLNSVPLVNVKGLEKYAINDLILELNHFLDKNTIETIEKEVFVEGLKQEWDLPKDLMLSETRNKEIDLVLGQVEENSYRHAGKFDQQEMEGLNKMFETNKKEKIFDKTWVISII